MGVCLENLRRSGNHILPSWLYHHLIHPSRTNWGSFSSNIAVHSNSVFATNDDALSVNLTDFDIISKAVSPVITMKKQTSPSGIQTTEPENTSPTPYRNHCTTHFLQMWFWVNVDLRASCSALIKKERWRKDHLRILWSFSLTQQINYRGMRCCVHNATQDLFSQHYMSDGERVHGLVGETSCTEIGRGRP